jgi:hypothetical protein
MSSRLHDSAISSLAFLYIWALIWSPKPPIKWQEPEPTVWNRPKRRFHFSQNNSSRRKPLLKGKGHAHLLGKDEYGFYVYEFEDGNILRLPPIRGGADPTTVSCCGFECGIFGPHFTSTAGSPAFVTSGQRSGLRALEIDTTLAVSHIARVGSVHGASAVRFYITFDTLPSGNVELIRYEGNVRTFGLLYVASTTSLRTHSDGVPVQLSKVITTGVQYRVEIGITSTSSSSPYRLSIDEEELYAANVAQLTTNIVDLRIGIVNANVTAKLRIDDFLYSATFADYPIGNGYIISYIPDSDGTHSGSGNNDFEYSDTGTAIPYNATDVYTLVNKRPMPSSITTHIRANAPTSSEYVEVAYEDSVELRAPRSVEGIVRWHDQGGAGTQNFSVTLRDHGGGTTDDIKPAGAANVGTTLQSRRTHFLTIPGTSDPWTLTAFNALRTRMIVTDASPDPSIDGLMLEAEYWQDTPGPLRRIRVSNQAVKRAANW